MGGFSRLFFTPENNENVLYITLRAMNFIRKDMVSYTAFPQVLHSIH